MTGRFSRLARHPGGGVHVALRFVRSALEEKAGMFTATMQRGMIEAGTRTPGLIALDLGLPDGDGIEFIADLRKWSSVPVIVLSARNNETEKIRARCRRR